MAKAIGTLGNVDSITVGGRVFTDLTTLKILVATTAANTNATFRTMNGTSGYTPSGATTFVVHAMKAIGTAAGTTWGSLGYGDNDVGINSGTTPTNAVYVGGSSTVTTHATSTIAAGSQVPSEMAHPMQFTIPNGKYPAMIGGANQTVYLYGYEV